jgi:hypothetical protein
VCAQLEAALRRELPVGCDTPTRDDFDDWLPRPRWRSADVLLWVTDRRFAPRDLPDHVAVRSRDVVVDRAGVEVRRFTLTLYVREAQSSASR